LGWFSLWLLSFTSPVPPVDDYWNHNGFLMPSNEWVKLMANGERHDLLVSDRPALIGVIARSI
jgi:hypothetical protein